MKEARYKTSAYKENTPTVTSAGTTLLQPVASPIHSISPGVVNYPEQIKVMPYDELVKMQERVAELEEVVQELKYLIEAKSK